MPRCCAPPTSGSRRPRHDDAAAQRSRRPQRAACRRRARRDAGDRADRTAGLAGGGDPGRCEPSDAETVHAGRDQRCRRGGPRRSRMNEPRPPVGAPPEAGPSGTNGIRGQPRARSGLMARIVLGVGGLAAGLTIVFALLLIAVVGLRHRSNEARRSQEVIATANGLQTLLIDFETGLRGFVIWKDKRYLEPWVSARKQYPDEKRKLLRLTEGEPRQHVAARQIADAIDSYLQDISLRLVAFLERNPQASRTVAASETGSQQVQGFGNAS